MKITAVLAASAGVILIPNAWLLATLVGLAVMAALFLSATGRRGLRTFALWTLPLTSFTYAAMGPGDGEVVLVGLGLDGRDFLLGLSIGARLTGLMAVAALGARAVPSRELLPAVSRSTFPGYVVGSLLRLVPSLRTDWGNLREAQAARGHRLRPGVRAVQTWIPLMVPLFVQTMRRAREQTIALHLAGLAPDRHAVPATRAHRWAIVVSLSALAIAGRLALVNIPNVSLGYFVLFVAGVAYGPLVGLQVGLIARLSTDLMLTGLNPIFAPMAGVDALFGAVAGLLGRLVNFGQRDRQPYAYTAILAGVTGWAMTAFYSIAADTATWTFFRLMPSADGGASEALWTLLVVRGLIFNIPAMIVNAVLFAGGAYPVLRALRLSGALAPSPTSRPPKHVAAGFTG